MSRPKILLTNSIHAAGVRILEKVADIVTAPDVQAETLKRMAADVDGIIVRAQLPPDIFEYTPRLCGVVRHGVGLDMIPIEAATAHGVIVANVPGANAQAVAEYGIAGMLMLTRRLHLIDRELRTKDWNTSRLIADKATEIFGRTVGIIGVGNVGRRIAEICKDAFRMRILGYQRNINALPEFIQGVDLDSLFLESDFIVVSCPLTNETRHLVNRSRLGKMKSDSVLINVARGPVIEEAALVDALRENRIGGAMLDVFAEQPIKRDHPLLQMSNVILTPHVAGITDESMKKMSEGAAQDLLRVIAGEKPLNFINPEAWGAYLERRRKLLLGPA